MIRVIYRWRVQQAKQERFTAAWSEATNRIERSTPGARGSALQSHQDPCEFVTIARWDEVEHWKAFWKDAARTEMHDMHDLAERLSADAFDELGDFTV